MQTDIVTVDEPLTQSEHLVCRSSLNLSLNFAGRHQEQQQQQQLKSGHLFAHAGAAWETGLSAHLLVTHIARDGSDFPRLH